MPAALGFWDFFWIAIIVMFLAGGTSVYSKFKASDARRLRRVERKLDLILNELNLKYEDDYPGPELSEQVRQLADDPNQKIAAIKLYREQTGASLAEAKEAIEAYLRHQG
jgi:CHASE3 domain sensor protein